MDNYNVNLKEIKSIEKEIQEQTRQLKEKQNENTIRLETAIKKKLDDYSAKIVKIFNEYQNTNIKSTM